MMSGDDLLDHATLLFREQADGRKVSRLPSGKVVLIHPEALDRVRDSQRWKVRLEQRENYAIAFPVELVESATPTLVTPVVPKAPTPSAAFKISPRNPTQIVMPPSARAAPEAVKAPSHEIARLTPPVELPRIVIGSATPVTPGDIIHKDDRVAIFIDGANTDGASRSMGYFVDFGKAKRYFSSTGVFYGGFYFVADFTHTDPLQVRFLDFLSHSGFVVRRKAVKKLVDEETGATYYKSNVDTEVVVELLNTQDNYDVAFLFSGDSDYERVVDILRSRGKRVYVVTSRANLSRELSYVADKPIFYLEDHKAALEREAKASAV